MRDYQEGGRSLQGQIGQEPTPQEFLESLWTCTAEWMRVLKPSGSIFVNLGDKWAGGGGRPSNGNTIGGPGTIANGGATWGFRPKSLMNLPARYAIGCTDRLGLIQREEILWRKVNSLPESVKDRCRRSHEMVFHFTKNPVYYSAIDRIREEHQGDGNGKSWKQRKALGEAMRYGDTGAGASGGMSGGLAGNAKGKLPPSVWDIPLSWVDLLRSLPPELAVRVAEEAGLPEDVWDIATAPLNVPRYVAEETIDGTEFDFDHYAAFPPALPAKIIDGWCPVGICTRCGQGRFPVSVTSQEPTGRVNSGDAHRQQDGMGRAFNGEGKQHTVSSTRVIGSACACTPYTDHPERRGQDWRGDDSGDRLTTGQRMGKDFQGNGHPSRSGGEFRPSNELNEYGRGEVREYHFDQWEPAPTEMAVVLDPFGGTGTTAITAAKMGRRGISCDLSWDCAKPLIEWRMYDLSQNRRK